MIALLVLLQADVAAEIEKLSEAYAKLQTLHAVYEGRSGTERMRFDCRLDRPGRRACLLTTYKDDGVEKQAHLLMEDQVLKTWTSDGKAVLIDLGFPLKTVEQETASAEAELRKLLPPALALPPDRPVAHGFLLDLNEGNIQFAIVFFAVGGRIPLARQLKGASLVDDPADAVFRHPQEEKTWRVDRATGLVRSVSYVNEGKTKEIVLLQLKQPSEFPALTLPEKFQEHPAPLELLDLVLRLRADELRDLIEVFRGAWAGLPADVHHKIPPLLRRWFVAYADGLRTHRIRLWVAEDVNRKKDMLPMMVLVVDAVAGGMHEMFEKGAEQERAQVVRDLARLAASLKPAKPDDAAQGLDDAVQEAISADAVWPALPALTKERMKALYLEQIERAKPK